MNTNVIHVIPVAEVVRFLYQSSAVCGYGGLKLV